MITPLRHTLRLLPLAGLLFLAACPQMTTGAISGAGSPLNATGEKTSSSTATTDTDKASGTDETAPPPAAAPVPPPPPSGGGDAGGLGGAGSGSTEYSAMMRRVPEGGTPEVPPSEPITVARESGGGVLGAPSDREAVDTPIKQLRMVFWRSSERRTWADAEDFFAKLSAGQISDDIADGAKVEHWIISIDPNFLYIGEPYQVLHEEEDILRSRIAQEPGYYLFFFEDGNVFEIGPPSVDVTSAAHLKSLLQPDQVNSEGMPFRLRFVGERTISPMPVIDPRFLRQLQIPGRVVPEVRPSLLHPIQP